MLYLLVLFLVLFGMGFTVTQRASAQLPPSRQPPSHVAALALKPPAGALRARDDTLRPDARRPASSPLVSRSDLALMGGFLAGTIALVPLDQSITEEFRDPGPQRSPLLQRAAGYFNTVGDPGVLVAGVGLYVVGRVGHRSRLAQLGLYGTEAIVVSGAATALLKGIVGRARPYLDEHDSDGFGLNRGFHDGKDASFPSGHATAAFAAAAVLAGESARWWPHAARYIAPLAYGGATMVALARVYSDKHWSSDVLTGAGIGTLSGLAIVHFNEAHPHNVINRWLLGASLLPAARGGMSLAWTIHTR